MADIVISSIDDFETGLITVGTAGATMPTLKKLITLKRGIEFRSDKNNTATVMVGAGPELDPTSGPGFPLYADESVFVPVNNPKKVFFKASADGAKLWFLAS